MEKITSDAIFLTSLVRYKNFNKTKKTYTFLVSNSMYSNVNGEF